MIFKKTIKKKLFPIVFLFLIIFNLNFIITESIGLIKDIPGNSVNNDTILPNETINYNFTNNNVLFGISTDTFTNVNINLDTSVSNRESLMLITNNNNSLHLDLILKRNIEQFGLQKKPKGPSDGKLQYRYGFNYIIRIRANESVQNITFQYKKSMRYGLNPNLNYNIVKFQEELESWDLIEEHKLYFLILNDKGFEIKIK